MLLLASFTTLLSLVFINSVSANQPNTDAQPERPSYCLDTVCRVFQNFITPSIWEQAGQGSNKHLSKQGKIELFTKDVQNLAKENQYIPPKTDDIVRIATYNVHHWADAYETENLDRTLETIKTINADILILQETSWGQSCFLEISADALEEKLRKIGYAHGYDSFCHSASICGAQVGNIILSKYPLTKISQKVFDVNETNFPEVRCFIRTEIVVPGISQPLVVYGTHLDVLDKTEHVRRVQMQELAHIVKKEKNNNVLVAADFNSLKKDDYAYAIQGVPVWDLIQADSKARGTAAPTSVLDILTQEGFKSSFAMIGLQNPTFTVWSGKSVDFIFLSKNWDIPVVGSYVYYDTASDHLPVIMDLLKTR